MGGDNNYGGMVGSNGFQNEARSLSYLDEKTANKAMADSLKNATVDKYPTAVTTFKTNQEGTFYYICQYPGHAAKGAELVINLGLGNIG